MPEEEITQEMLLQKSMGDFGCYQLFITFLIYLHRMPVGFHLLLVVLHGVPPGNFTCSDPKFAACDPDCPSHVFDHSLMEKTTIHEWDLVCSRKMYTSMIQMFAMFGILCGALVFGWLGDRFGRKWPLCFAVTMQLIVGVSTGFCTNLILFIFMRWLTTFFTGGSMVPPFAFLMEITPKKYRTWIGVWYTIPVHIGHALLAAVGYYFRRWDHQQMVVSAFSVVLLSYICFLPESPRWLFTMNRTKQGTAVLVRGAKCNRRPTDHIAPMVDQYMEQMKAGAATTTGGDIRDLLRTKRMRTKTLIMIANWMTTALVFYAIGQYIGTIGGDLFSNIAIAGAMQIPFNIIGSIIIGFVGRKWTIVISYMLVSLPMLLVCVLPATPTMPITILCSISMGGAAMSFALMYVYSGELFPTIVRSVGLGICSMMGRIGSMVAPFIMDLKPLGEWVPPLVFASIPFIVAFLTMILLPETMNKPLPDTIEEADQI